MPDTLTEPARAAVPPGLFPGGPAGEPKAHRRRGLYPTRRWTILVLGRRKGEEIIVEVDGQRILIRVTQVVGGRVRLGFTASPHVRIHRHEVLNDAKEAHR